MNARFISLVSLALSLMLVNSFWQIRVHYNEMSRREATKEENVVGIRDDEFYIQRYKKEKERLNLKIDINTNLGKFG